jgi:hypothetical protein
LALTNCNVCIRAIVSLVHDVHAYLYIFSATLALADTYCCKLQRTCLCTHWTRRARRFHLTFQHTRIRWHTHISRHSRRHSGSFTSLPTRMMRRRYVAHTLYTRAHAHMRLLHAVTRTQTRCDRTVRLDDCRYRKALPLPAYHRKTHCRSHSLARTHSRSRQCRFNQAQDVCPHTQCPLSLSHALTHTHTHTHTPGAKARWEANLHQH